MTVDLNFMLYSYTGALQVSLKSAETMWLLAK